MFMHGSCSLKTVCENGQRSDIQICQRSLQRPSLNSSLSSLSSSTFLIAFYLDSDECVNAISRVRKDEKDRLSSSSVCPCMSLGNREKNISIYECRFAYIMLSQLAENQLTPSLVYRSAFEYNWRVKTKKNG